MNKPVDEGRRKVLMGLGGLLAAAVSVPLLKGGEPVEGALEEALADPTDIVRLEPLPSEMDEALAEAAAGPVRRVWLKNLSGQQTDMLVTDLLYRRLFDVTDPTDIDPTDSQNPAITGGSTMYEDQGGWEGSGV